MDSEHDRAVALGYFYGRTGTDHEMLRHEFGGENLATFDEWIGLGFRDAANPDLNDDEHED